MRSSPQGKGRPPYTWQPLRAGWASGLLSQGLRRYRGESIRGFPASLGLAPGRGSDRDARLRWWQWRDNLPGSGWGHASPCGSAPEGCGASGLPGWDWDTFRQHLPSGVFEEVTWALILPVTPLSPCPWPSSRRSRSYWVQSPSPRRAPEPGHHFSGCSMSGQRVLSRSGVLARPDPARPERAVRGRAPRDVRLPCGAGRPPGASLHGVSSANTALSPSARASVPACGEGLQQRRCPAPLAFDKLGGRR